MDPLSRRDRAPRRVADACQAGRHVERNGLLQPGRGERLELGCDLRGNCGRKATVHLDHDLDVGADGLPHRRHELDRRPPLGGRQPHRSASKRIELECRVASSDDLACTFRECLGVAIRLVPPVGVSPNAVSVPPAEKLPDGEVQLLPDQIPAGDVERRERRLRDLARSAVLRPLDVERERLPVERIGADDVSIGELADARDERVRLVDHPNLADAAAAILQDELDERELPPRRTDDRREDLDDPHASLSFGSGFGTSCSTVRRSLSVCRRWSRIASAAAFGLRSLTASRIAWCCWITSSIPPPRSR